MQLLNAHVLKIYCLLMWGKHFGGDTPQDYFCSCLSAGGDGGGGCNAEMCHRHGASSSARIAATAPLPISLYAVGITTAAILSLLVCLCMVLVVLDPPWLKGVDEWHEGQGTHNVLKQLVVTEAAVTTVMANHKELQTGDGGGQASTQVITAGARLLGCMQAAEKGVPV